MLKGDVVHNSFIFHASFIKTLPADRTAEWVQYIIDYGICGIEPKFDDPIYQELFNKIKERIDADKIKYNKKIENQKEYQKKYYEKKKAEKDSKDIQDFKNFKDLKNIESIENVDNNLKVLPIYEYDSDSEFDSEFESDSVSVSEFDSDARERLIYAVHLWNQNSHILGICNTIQHKIDLLKLLSNKLYTKVYIENGFKGFIDAVKNGDIEKKYVPKTIDTFLLKNYLTTYQPVNTEHHNSDPEDSAKLEEAYRELNNGN